MDGVTGRTTKRDVIIAASINLEVDESDILCIVMTSSKTDMSLKRFTSQTAGKPIMANPL